MFFFFPSCCSYFDVGIRCMGLYLKAVDGVAVSFNNRHVTGTWPMSSTVTAKVSVE